MDSQPPTRTRPRRAFLGSTAAIAAVGGCLRLQSDQDGSGGETTVAEDGGGGTDTTGRRTMRIGFLLPLSGTLSEFGSRMRNAADLPLRQLEQDPNVELTVETRVADTGSTVERGLQAGEELLSAGYPAVVGPATSSLSMEAASQVFGAVESVACSPSATSPTITTVEDDDFVFRTAPSATFRGLALGTATAQQTTVNTVAVLHQDDAYGRGIADSFRTRFGSLGGTVQMETAYTTDASSYTSQLEDALAGAPDALVVSGGLDATVRVIGDLRTDVDSDAPVLVSLAHPDLPSRAGYDLGDVRGVQLAPRGEGQEYFLQLYDQEFGGTPGRFSASSYDAMAVLLLANAAAGANDGPAIRDAMREVTNPGGDTVVPQALPEGIQAASRGDAVEYVGASGSVDFDDNGDVTAFSYAFVRVGTDGNEQITTVTVEG